jgi:hypothetical protein
MNTVDTTHMETHGSDNLNAKFRHLTSAIKNQITQGQNMCNASKILSIGEEAMLNSHNPSRL